jgi:acetyl-CoA acetyltransferase
VTTAERAADLDARPVALLGAAEQHECAYVTQLDDVAVPGGARAFANALRIADVGVDDLDALYLYDAAAISVVVLLEEIGRCARGEGGGYVADKGLGPDSPLPVNTHGGLLAHGHPGKPGGMFHITEAVRQIRGEAGDRQVDGCSVALVHGSAGALVSHAVVVLGPGW